MALKIDDGEYRLKCHSSQQSLLNHKSTPYELEVEYPSLRTNSNGTIKLKGVARASHGQDHAG